MSETELELLTLLRRGKTDWATFSKDHIVAALAVALAVPAIALPAAQRDPIEEVPQVKPNPEADLPIGTSFIIFVLFLCTSHCASCAIELLNNKCRALFV